MQNERQFINNDRNLGKKYGDFRDTKFNFGYNSLSKNSNISAKERKMIYDRRKALRNNDPDQSKYFRKLSEKNILHNLNRADTGYEDRSLNPNKLQMNKTKARLLSKFDGENFNHKYYDKAQKILKRTERDGYNSGRIGALRKRTSAQIDAANEYAKHGRAIDYESTDDYIDDLLDTMYEAYYYDLLDDAEYEAFVESVYEADDIYDIYNVEDVFESYID